MKKEQVNQMIPCQVDVNVLPPVVKNHHRHLHRSIRKYEPMAAPGERDTTCMEPPTTIIDNVSSGCCGYSDLDPDHTASVVVSAAATSTAAVDDIGSDDDGHNDTQYSFHDKLKRTIGHYDDHDDEEDYEDNDDDDDGTLTTMTTITTTTTTTTDEESQQRHNMEEEEEGLYCMNEICIFHVNAKKHHKKFLYKFFTKNYGKVSKVRMVVENNNFPHALALIRFEDVNIAHQLIDIGKICFTPHEKGAPVHKIKRKKRLNKNQKKKKKKRSNNTNNNNNNSNNNNNNNNNNTDRNNIGKDTTSIISEQVVLPQIIVSNSVGDEKDDKLPLSLSPNMNAHATVLCDETSSINDDSSSVISGTSSNCEVLGNGSDPINIKKKKPRKRNNKGNSSHKSILHIIHEHRDEILSYMIQHTPLIHDQIAYELTVILFPDEAKKIDVQEQLTPRRNHDPYRSNSQSNHLLSEQEQLHEELALYNFLLMMNIMPNSDLTSIILQQCEQTRQKIEQMRNLPKVQPAQNIDLVLESGAKYKTSVYTTGQYRLKKEIDNLIEDVTQTKQELYHNQNFLKTIEKACEQVFKDMNYTISPYGSSANGFSMRGSDVDLALNFYESDVDDKCKPLKKLMDRLKLDGVHSVKLIGQRVPILKIHHFNVECDVCVNNYFAVVNTKLLYTYSRIDKRLKEVVHVIKYWAKNVGINDSSQGTLSSYSYVLMVVFYFQNIGILPSLQKLINHEAVSTQDIAYTDPVLGQDCRFVSNLHMINKIVQNEMKPTNARVTELVIDFFSFYKMFDFNKYSICIKSGVPIEKKPWSKDHLISIIDPFEHQRDLGCVIASKKRSQSIINEIFEAAQILAAGGTLCDVTENSIARQFGSLSRQVDKAGTFRRYPSTQALEKILQNKNFAAGTLIVESLDPVKAYVILDNDNSVVHMGTIGAINRALHMDHVFIKKITQTQGQVVTVLDKISPKVFACVAEVHADFVWMKPIDQRYPKMITTAQFFAKTLNCKQKQAHRYSGFVFACQMDTWKDNERYPQVHSLEVLGSTFDPLTANKFMTINEDHYLVSSNTKKPSPARSATHYSYSRRNNSIDETGECIFSISDQLIKSTAFKIHDTLTGYRISVYIPDVNNYMGNNEMEYDNFWGLDLGATMAPIVDPVLAELCSFEPQREISAICISWSVNDRDYAVSDVKVYFANIASQCNFSTTFIQDLITSPNPDAITAPREFTSDKYSWDTVKDMLLLLARGAKTQFSSVEAMKQFRLVFGNCSGIPTGIHNVRDAVQLVKFYEIAANRIASSHILSSRPQKKRYFVPWPAKDKQQTAVSTRLEQLLRNLESPQHQQNQQLSIHHRIINHITQLPENSTRFCAEHIAICQFTLQSEWKYMNPVAPITEFTSPIFNFPNLFAHRLLESFCSRKEEQDWEVNPKEITEIEKELNESVIEARRVQKIAYYHNVSAYLLHYSTMNERITEAVVMDGIISPEMEILLFLPKFGLEVKCILTQLCPSPSKIYMNLKTHSTRLEFCHNGDTSSDDESEGEIILPKQTYQMNNIVELHALSTVLVELTVDMNCYPHELIVHRICMSDHS